MHLTFKKIYDAVRETVAYCSILYKIHPIITAGASSSKFSINSANEFLVGKKSVFVFSELVFT